jgi:hypothetical protein
MPYSADQPRDEAGKRTETGAANAGKAADEASRQADERDEELGSASGYNRHHGEAAGLYKTAAEHSRGVAAQHLAAGNAVAAARYEAEAKKRDSMAERHGAAAGSNEAYRGAVNAQVIAVAKPHQAPSTNKNSEKDRARHAKTAERASENDDEVRSNLEPHLRPLWERQKSRWSAAKMSPEQREESFRKYVHDRPGEAHEAVQAHADQKLNRLIEQKSGLGAWASKTARGKVIKSSSNGKSGLDKWASAGTDAVPF